MNAQERYETLKRIQAHAMDIIKESKSLADYSEVKSDRQLALDVSGCAAQIEAEVRHILEPEPADQ